MSGLGYVIFHLPVQNESVSQVKEFLSLHKK